MAENYAFRMKDESLSHHGIEGQKWGVRNGPPYPLGSGQHSKAELRAIYRENYKKTKKEFSDIPKGGKVSISQSVSDLLAKNSEIINRHAEAISRPYKLQESWLKSKKYLDFVNEEVEELAYDGYGLVTDDTKKKILSALSESKSEFFNDFLSSDKISKDDLNTFIRSVDNETKARKALSDVFSMISEDSLGKYADRKVGFTSSFDSKVVVDKAKYVLQRAIHNYIYDNNESLKWVAEVTERWNRDLEAYDKYMESNSST